MLSVEVSNVGESVTEALLFSAIGKGGLRMFRCAMKSGASMSLSSVLVFLAAVSVHAASFHYPVDLAVNRKGQIFVTDPEAHSVFAISEDKTVSLLAQGKPDYRAPLFRVRGIALDKQDQVIVADGGSSEVYRITPDGKAMPLASGKLDRPEDVDVDSRGDLIVADHGGQAIYRISKEGSVQRIAQVENPLSVAVDKDNGIIVISNRGLVKVSPAGRVEAITRKNAFEYPNSVVINPAGEYIVSDGYAKTLWKVQKDGNFTALVKGDPLKNPNGLAIDNKGDILIADPHAKAIFRVSAGAKISVVVKE
jgi:sugar lactone lactonase YvrE